MPRKQGRACEGERERERERERENLYPLWDAQAGLHARIMELSGGTRTPTHATPVYM